MPTHAILGATGATGSAILRYLLEGSIPDLTINIFVRSQKKLLSAFPGLESHPSARINIFTGTITDTTTLAACLKTATVIYVCVSTNVPTKDLDIAHSAAESVKTALYTNAHTQGSAYAVPVLTINRSMALNTSNVEPPLPRFVMKFFHWLIRPIYDDLERAVEVYQAAEKEGLVEWIVLDGPQLRNEKNTKRTGHRFLVDGGKVSADITYADL